ncbi:FecCD family ABC transporter permease [Erysipelothrix aquatica]|uniref:FecCD family ABC transporter permease n=1 Tax=Erysipelothrix aquatica TaxID=2683714 RepID=UPI0013585CA0|nr:iron ABC transporter permease [Erysipelothrix aquatica]
MFKNKISLIVLLIILFVLSITTVLSSIAFGSIKINFTEIYEIIVKGQQTRNYQILVNIRLTRVVFAIVGGMSLGISGLLLQIVLRNPMADSGSLGISSGALFATTLVLLVIPLNSDLVPLVSFVGGMGSFFLILLISWEKELTPVRLILTGAALNAILRGGQSLFITLYSDKLQGVITWQNGNLAGKTWQEFWLYLMYIIPAFITITLLHRKINVLNLSEQTNYSLGVPIAKYRMIVATLGVYISAITVSQLGMIGFVGLLVPHMAKSIVGSSMKKSLPLTAILGSNLLLLADLLSRTIASPIEIPIGTVMSIIGGPFFLYLISRRNKKY